MDRLHAPKQFFRIRTPREGILAWEQLWRLLADGPHRHASQEGDDGSDAVHRLILQRGIVIRRRPMLELASAAVVAGLGAGLMKPSAQCPVTPVELVGGGPGCRQPITLLSAYPGVLGLRRRVPWPPSNAISRVPHPAARDTRSRPRPGHVRRPRHDRRRPHPRHTPGAPVVCVEQAAAGAVRAPSRRIIAAVADLMFRNGVAGISTPRSGTRRASVHRRSTTTSQTTTPRPTRLSRPKRS
jgi:hypothetical protein